LIASRSRIALAIGDPNGIGPEIAVKAAIALAGGPPHVILVGDVFVVEHYAAREAKDYAVRQITADVPPAAQTIDVVAVDTLPRNAFTPGRIEAAAGRATVAIPSQPICSRTAKTFG
jgi:4-hydroxythreonine-4-phosphate dehydrogenase